METPMPDPEPEAMTIQERRLVELPKAGAIRKAIMPLVTVIVVSLAQDEEAPTVVGSELGVPFPVMVIPMPLGTLMPEAQVQFPEGMLMVSPSLAVCVGPLMTAFTFFWVQSTAV